jgi:membrane-bound lytic murein transglycosylase MltF
MTIRLARPTRLLPVALLMLALPRPAFPQAAPATPTAPPAQDDRRIVEERWTGDFDGMVKRRQIRVLTPYSKTHYFIDKGLQRGLAYEVGVKLETELNAKLKTGLHDKVHVTFVPTSRDQLYQSLVDGRGDVVVAPITITPERQKLVDFSTPTWRGATEVLVTGPGASIITSRDDLSGKIVAVRGGSIYAESLEALNVSLKERKMAPVAIEPLPGTLEDEDILEMVNAGLVKATVVQDFTARFWKQILPSIVVHDQVTLRDGADLGWIVRKGSPKLLAELNPLIAKFGKGSEFGNVALRKYLQNTKVVKGATSDAEIRKFRELVQIFRKYGDQYDMDFLLMLAQGYQESRLDQTVKSQVGAVGVMQIMPATGKDLKVGDIQQLEPNIQGGVKYMRNLVDTYFKDDKMDRVNKGLMAFASYNAGPGRIRTLRKETASRGLDPNVWFNNVERVVAEKIGRETVTYVSNIYKYYVAYTLVLKELKAKEAAKGKAR